MAARGLIIVLPLLIAAGVAVYESPQVRQFLDEHRRKLALAINDLGDQFSGAGSDSQRPTPRRGMSRDVASSREDASPEAEERRRKYREEIAQRRRLMEERKAGRSGLTRRGSSFDDLVDPDGNLRGTASGVGGGAMEMGTLRRRHNESAGATLGSSFANPFSDEMALDSSIERSSMSDEELARQLQAHFDEEYAISQRPQSDEPLSQLEVQELERIVREEAEKQGRELPEPGTSLEMSEKELISNLSHLQAELNRSEPASTGRHTPATSAAPSTRTVPRTPPSEDLSSEHEAVLVDTGSTHPSEAQLIDFTPTTSAPGTPRQAPRQPVHQQSYQSIQDWAEQSMNASFHSLYDSSVGAVRSSHSDVSDLESIGAPSEAASDMDVVSELGISTPGTWTEVGSVVSAEEQEQEHGQSQQHGQAQH